MLRLTLKYLVYKRTGKVSIVPNRGVMKQWSAKSIRWDIMIDEENFFLYDPRKVHCGSQRLWNRQERHQHSVLAVNLDFNSKLHGLINELRGELGAAQRGNKDAKDRLLKKIAITQFVIREHKNSTQLSTEIPEYNQKFIDDMKSLLISYRIQGKEQLFRADMELLAGAYRGAGYTDLFLQSVEALIRSLLSR
ncbi:hypothetical protein OS493_039963 [Desmophyllum pertusum]|uniref:Uncharacterized protein n=1 Tax=Desmophyllum pertusum TaxID=174260 RepID=A0A9X0D6A6_9CNID|nr:hypothetical protein OS493_039963 [Desmophyllum pertusum]